MIPFHFDYYRPDTIKEAVDLYGELELQNKEPLYYSGGTEIITMARMNNIFTKAVIDLKGIPECQVFETNGDEFVVGSAVTLSQITEADFFPLLTRSCGRIADHTVQGKITIGGNMMGTIRYKESILPLLLSESRIVFAREKGTRIVSIKDVFKEKILHKKGEFIVQILINKDYAHLPYVHVKKTKNEKIDYPLLTLTAMKKDGSIRLAFSGLCPSPFRSESVEAAVNNPNLQTKDKIKQVIANLPDKIVSDIWGSKEYRQFVLEKTLENTMKVLGSEK